MLTHPRAARMESPSTCRPEGERGGRGSLSPTAVEERRPTSINVNYHHKQWTQAAASPRPGREVAGGINTPKPLSSHPLCCYLSSSEPNWKLGDRRSWCCYPWKSGSQAKKQGGGEWRMDQSGKWEYPEWLYLKRFGQVLLIQGFMQTVKAL